MDNGYDFWLTLGDELIEETPEYYEHFKEPTMQNKPNKKIV
jgi:hypothetical protein